ncbi:hypothetical protein [Stigmatella hybrida]|uniref:hypothetical protein n=1 Tax=Stigmatella hybrida TaxID=394097 RepID=UPI001CDA68A4|nr:hypothetical protein [Stigmatella hybrida]
MATKLRCLALMLVTLGGAGSCRAHQEDGIPAAMACVDDAWEDDDTLEQGKATPPLSHIYNHGPLVLEGRVACPGDADWIQAWVDCCHPAGAVVRWDASRGPLEVELLDSSGQPIPLSEPGDTVQRQPGEIRLLRAELQNVFFVRVRAGGAAAVPYTVSLIAPVFVHRRPEDLFEPSAACALAQGRRGGPVGCL